MIFNGPDKYYDFIIEQKHLAIDCIVITDCYFDFGPYIYMSDCKIKLIGNTNWHRLHNFNTYLNRKTINQSKINNISEDNTEGVYCKLAFNKILICSFMHVYSCLQEWVKNYKMSMGKTSGISC